jgi:Zn-dependent protease with chaperone function
MAVALALSAASAATAGLAVPQDSARSIALGHQLDVYWIAGKLLGLLIPAGFLFSGAGARLRRFCGRIGCGIRYATLVWFGCAYVLLDALLNLPLDYLRHYRLPASLGWLGNETPGGWLLDQLPPLAVFMAGVILFLWIPYTLIRRSPRRWWLWSAALLTVAALFVLIVQPIWIKPLTTTYAPLADKTLRTQIDALVQRCGIRDIPIVVGGGDTSVLGLGPTNRVILQHDLSRLETPAQIRFTVGHELKHYVMGDNWKALAIAAALLLGGFWITHRLGGWSISRWHRRFGFDRLDDPASLPLFVFCLSALWLAVTPAFLAFDRHIEAEADRFGLELTHENDAAARMFASWAGGAELAEPGWFERTFRATHPSVAERIRMANSYRPWATGAVLEYASRCSMAAPPP